MLALRTAAREHQPLVFCLRRGLLRSRDLPSLSWGFSPLETTPHIQQAHPSTCPKCRQRWGSRSSLNLPVSLHRLSTASDGGGRGAGGRGWGEGGRFPLLPCFSPIREPGTFPARSKSSHCPVSRLLRPAPRPLAWCGHAPAGMSRKGRECSISPLLVWRRSSKWEGQGWDLDCDCPAFGLMAQAAKEPGGRVRCGPPRIRTIYCCNQ